MSSDGSRIAVKSACRPFRGFRGRSGLLAVTRGREGQLVGHFGGFVAAPACWRPRMAAKSARRSLSGFRGHSGLLAVTRGREIGLSAISGVSWPLRLVGGHAWPRSRLGGHFRGFRGRSGLLAATRGREVGLAVTFGVSWPLRLVGGHAWPRSRLGGHFRGFVAAPACWRPRMAAKSARRPFQGFRGRSGLLAATHGREIGSAVTFGVLWPPRSLWRSSVTVNRFLRTRLAA